MNDERKAWEQVLTDLHDKKFPVDPADSLEIKKAMFEKLQLAFWNIMDCYPAIGENAQLDLRYSQEVVNQIVFYVRSWILDGHKVDRLVPTQIDFPATWWDHWKQDHGPEWLVKRWPVKSKTTFVTKEIHQHYVCPHINVKDDRNQHIMWMYEMSRQGERDK